MTLDRSRALVGRFSGMVTCLLSLALAGCSLFQPSEHFLIRVDSIAVPSSVVSGDTLAARFFGWIGRDGCWGLARVDRHVTPTSLDVTFHGEHSVPIGAACTASLVALNYVDVVAPPFSTPFTITVHQPDGSLLRRQVAGQ
jgi:hypothetical protein